MPSVISHAVATLPIGAACYRRNLRKWLWASGIVCSTLPDLDVIGFRFGIHYGDFWGHRGFTHSLAFAVLLAVAVTFGAARLQPEIPKLRSFLYLFFATASHGLLDAMTNGGLGVAFFSPFDTHRYFLPWRPIRVSPLGITRFFSPRGILILQNEIVWIWVPSLVLLAMVAIWQRSRLSGSGDGGISS